MSRIEEQLATLPEALLPLREKALEYARHPSKRGEGGVLHIGHRPWVAELNYAIMLYPGVDASSLRKYSITFGISIPPTYIKLLQAVNGAFCFGMNLCGIPPSMLADPPLLDRTVLQCHDLATAATEWAREYRLTEGLFHFGSRDFSSSEIVGYFIAPDASILCARKNGDTIGQWTSIRDFLAHEVVTAEELESELRPGKWGG